MPPDPPWEEGPFKIIPTCYAEYYPLVPKFIETPVIIIIITNTNNNNSNSNLFDEEADNYW